MKLRIATLALIALTLTLATSASASSGKVRSITSQLIENVQINTGAIDPTAKMGFWQNGPVGVASATTRLNGDDRLELFASSKGFVVNQLGAVYDFEGGATLNLRDDLALTGSYRMIGCDLLATGSGDLAPQLSGVFVGMQFEF
jgi:hypothetical protein